MKFCMCTTAKTLVGKCIRKFCLMLSKLVLQRKQITGGLVCVYVFSMDVYVMNCFSSETGLHFSEN